MSASQCVLLQRLGTHGFVWVRWRIGVDIYMCVFRHFTCKFQYNMRFTYCNICIYTYRDRFIQINVTFSYMWKLTASGPQKPSLCKSAVFQAILQQTSEQKEHVWFWHSCFILLGTSSFCVSTSNCSFAETLTEQTEQKKRCALRGLRWNKVCADNFILS